MIEVETLNEYIEFKKNIIKDIEKLSFVQLFLLKDTHSLQISIVKNTEE